MRNTDLSRTKLLDFIHDEDVNTENSLELLKDELPFVESLINIYLDFLNRQTNLRPGETKYYYLCSVCKTQTLKACINFLRLQISDGFSSSRIAADGALYALLMSMGRLSEDDYLNSQKARDEAIRKIGNDKKLGFEFPEILLMIREVRSMHSPHAHADPIFFVDRMIRHDSGEIGYSNFQQINDFDYRYFFMGMLWVGGMSLRAFLYIQEKEFDENVSRFSDRLKIWTTSLYDHRRAIGIFPNRPDDEGF